MAEPDYESMSPPELRAELRRVEDTIEDLEATFNFNLANTLVHLPEGMVAEHEAELEEYRALKARLERLLGDRGASAQDSP